MESASASASEKNIVQNKIKQNKATLTKSTIDLW